jgi:uncharacterized protein YndB with AHSA1/START domain
MPYSKMDCVIAAPDAGMVIAVAAFTADAERLFELMTDTVEIGRWWGGRRGGSLVTWIGTPEPGAEWRAEGVFSQNRTFTASGVFLQIEPAQRIVQSWLASWDGLSHTEASLRFERVQEGTVLSLVHRGFEGRADACQAQAQIWWKVIKWLRAHLLDE